MDVAPGSEVISGSISVSAALKIRSTKAFGESTVSKILDLVENASSEKAKAENFITKFARYYTPAVVIGAVLLAVVPPLFLGISDGAVWMSWLTRALSFLVVSCPCALVISVPLSFFGAIGGASKAGILVKGGNYLEVLNETDVFVMDKTGTITKGSFEVKKVLPEAKRDEILAAAAIAERLSTHPIARSIEEATGGEAPSDYRIEEIAGEGVKAVISSGDYSGELLICFENGKVARIPVSAYETKTNRRRLTGAYSDKSPLVAVLPLYEGSEVVLFASDGRALLFPPEAVPLKASRTTQGVAVMALKKKAVVTEAKFAPDTLIRNHARYRAKSLPAAGALLREDDRGEEQMSLI